MFLSSLQTPMNTLVIPPFFSGKDLFEKHLKKCSEIWGTLYKFEKESLVTFEDNYNFRGDLPFATYFDYETTTAASSGIKLEHYEMFPILLVRIFTFHPKLDIYKIKIEWSFSHSLAKLTDISCLTTDMLWMSFKIKICLPIQKCAQMS